MLCATGTGTLPQCTHVVMKNLGLFEDLCLLCRFLCAVQTSTGSQVRSRDFGAAPHSRDNAALHACDARWRVLCARPSIDHSCC